MPVEANPQHSNAATPKGPLAVPAEATTVTGAHEQLLALMTAGDEPVAPETEQPEDVGDEESEAPRAEDEATPADEPELEDQPDEDEPEQPALYTIPGSDEKVTLEEALKGYSRTADYTRKTQAAAELKKQAEAVEKAASAARDAYAQRLEKLDRFLEENSPKAPNWEQIKRDDPDNYPQLFADWQIASENRRKVQDERDRVAKEQGEERQKALALDLQHQHQQLVKAMPEFGDAAKAKSTFEAMLAHGETRGFTREELANVTDHRTILVLHDAMKYRELQAKADELKQKAATKPKAPAMKPGAPKQPERVDARVKEAQKRFQKSGHVKDAAALIAQLS